MQCFNHCFSDPLQGPLVFSTGLAVRNVYTFLHGLLIQSGGPGGTRGAPKGTVLEPRGCVPLGIAGADGDRSI